MGNVKIDGQRIGILKQGYVLKGSVWRKEKERKEKRRQQGNRIDRPPFHEHAFVNSRIGAVKQSTIGWNPKPAPSPSHPPKKKENRFRI